ncbi:MAG TPA: DEAD/DEAH box helicase [Planctomycetaceae bacterium]|jgi:superfamily II DNA or RNA helicase|nr:DEAD/DEAH box helicase [Planctomycetaceae bacterium]
MTLAELLEGRFRADVRFRGAAYLKAERVAIARVTSDELFAVVRDGVEYQTQLSRQDGRLKMFCNCVSSAQTEPSCKHLWGTVLAVDEGNYLSGEIKAGHVPPFFTEPRTPLVLDDDLEDDGDDLPGDFFEPGSSSGARSLGAPSIAVTGWQARLLQVRQTLAQEPVGQPSAPREQEVFYEIDVDQSRSIGQIVIQTSHRQRRGNGQWGKLKPLRLRPNRIDEAIDADDARILAYLSGGTPERGNWHAQQAEIQSAVHRFRIPHELCELIMPLMCATGRVRYLNSDERSNTPLAWDDGPPWELSLRLVPDDTEPDEVASSGKPTPLSFASEGESDELIAEPDSEADSPATQIDSVDSGSDPQETPAGADKGSWRVEGQLCRENEILPLGRTVLLVPGGLVLTAKRIARLRDFGAFAWVKLLERGERLRVPTGEEHDFIDQLLDMPALPRLDLPEELRLEEVTCDPLPHLTLRAPRGALLHGDRLQGDVSFDYCGTLVRASSSQWAIVQRALGRCIVRNKQREEQRWLQLVEQGFRRLLDPRRTGRDVEISARSLGPAVRSIAGEGWQVHADGKRVRQPTDLRFRVRSNVDWFELHAQVDFEGHTIRLPDLLSAVARGDTTVRLDDGSLGILPEEWIERFSLLATLGTAEEDHVRYAMNTVTMLDALLASMPETDYDSQFLELRSRLGSPLRIQAVDEPRDFHGELRGYQKEGLGWLKFLQELRFGGCLADDMGLGKTIQFLAVMVERKARNKAVVPSLVVVPKSLLFNWHSECTRFAPTLKAIEYSGIGRAAQRADLAKHDIVLTTYGTLRRDIGILKDIPFEYVVLDEAQTIKNAGSQIAKASRLLSARHRLALSGTPIENNLGDLWSIFEFLNPGMLGRSSLFKQFAAGTQDEQSHELLSQGLRPFILRRTKKEVASELPEKLEQTIHCDMRKEQRRIYQELRDSYRAALLGEIDRQGLGKTKMHVLEALLRLRQAACHPHLVNQSSDEESSAKLDVLLPDLEELIAEGHKALVFSQFTSMLAIVRKHLDRRGVVYEYLDGQTRDRRERVNRFQTDPACCVFLISLKAGGLGLNLTAADYVFLLDPWWNPAVEAQAIDRAHRVGQTRKVFAYRLICRGTVEEKIAELQDQKRSLADAILQADANLLKDLTVEDLERLLS